MMLFTTTVFLCIFLTSQADLEYPSFAEPITNQTVTAGSDVSFPCVINNLGTFRMRWSKPDKYTLLTFQGRVMVKDKRIGATWTDDRRTWWLHIRDVRESDKGEYMCQISTFSFHTEQSTFLEVLVPPAFDEGLTSSDTDVEEGEDVTLRCRATGNPTPEIEWITEDKTALKLGFDEFLYISNVTLRDMGAYLCLATNGIQPSATRRIMLNVKFAPTIWIPKLLVGAPLDTEVTLICNIETYPMAVTYWTREDGTMVLSNSKYNTMLLDKGSYKFEMNLRIMNLEPEDYGNYTCVAQNSLGRTEGTIRLYVPATYISGAPDLYVKTGSSIDLSCIISSSPEPPEFVLWSHNDHLINNDSLGVEIELQVDGNATAISRLSVENAQPTDSGNYTCDPSNADGSSVSVHVHNVSESSIREAPELRLVSGNSINLTCIINKFAEPLVFVFWYHEDRMINYELPPGAITVHSVDNDTAISGLYIPNAQPTDSGNYTCVPSNADSSSIDVQVVDVVKSSILEAPDLLVKTGSSVQLTCIISQSLELTELVLWFYNGRIFNDESPRIKITLLDGGDDTAISRIFIENAQPTDSGNYTCVPSNADFSSVRVQVFNVAMSTIREAPEQHVETGNSLSLTCIITHSRESPRFVFWYHEDSMINYDLYRGEITLQDVGNDTTISGLYIPNTQLTDSGNYTCVSSNADPSSVRVQVTNAPLPVLLGRRFNITVEAGKEAVLRCFDRNLGNYTLQWIRMDKNITLTHNKVVLTPDTRYSLILKGSRCSLKIRDVDESDTGEFQCQINTKPMKRLRVFLNVTGPHKDKSAVWRRKVELMASLLKLQI